ncbi:nucleotidyltransferase domain-containing protein [Sphingomonas sp.]|uniref:nucleotidyltransferase domain-containing protein n=1 Tax=Sphingomonas sp. TaxID=28214 RepID=UPI001DDB3484|nr:nucleotidyltransferase domain-containing protein [Sphingomonas sp.]MBX9797531.1 nucleotidyltransferase domain-containing protein [Sphingomonas sp.]
MDIDNALVRRVVDALGPVPGVVAIALGGSRARGTAGPASDYDIGLYYDGARPLDVTALRAAVAGLVDDPATSVTDIGTWGPWIDGGGWLTVGGVEVDILYREIGKVAGVIEDAEAGRFSMNYQVGHPHGFCSVILAGEAAIALPLHDPDGVLSALKRRAAAYPAALADALIARFGWEVDFAIENGELAARRGERTHIAGCAYRALCCVAQVLFAHNRRYLINEKGAVPAAAGLPETIGTLRSDADAIWHAIGNGAHDDALAMLRRLSSQLHDLTATSGQPLPG